MTSILSVVGTGAVLGVALVGTAVAVLAGRWVERRTQRRNATVTARLAEIDATATRADVDRRVRSAVATRQPALRVQHLDQAAEGQR